MTTQGMPSMDPRPTGLPIGTYDTYREAQRAVDYLSDEKFPVEHTTIVGNNLRQVEKITGRLTWGRAITAGLASGAWFGLFVGLLVGLFTTGPEWLGLVLGGAAIGAVWGALFGFFAHRATNGERDFSSAAGLAAEHYDVTVPVDGEQRALTLMAQKA